MCSLFCVQYSEIFVFENTASQKFGLPDNDDIHFKDIKDSSGTFQKWEVYQNLSYVSKTDFDIRMESKSDKRGKKEIRFEIQQIATYRHGLCSLIKYNESLSTKYGRVRLYFSYTGLATDMPKAATIFITSPFDWYGMVLDDWFQFNPFKTAFKIPLLEMNGTGTRRRAWIAKVSQTDYHYIEGVDDFEQCFVEQLAKNSNCNTTCYPTIYNFLPNFKPCNSSKNFYCMQRLLLKVDLRQMRYECLQAKKSIQYNANFVRSSQKLEKGTTGFVFSYYFDKGTKDVKEEVWTVTTGNFIGSVGGSLGLFLGFSCFTYLTGIIDKICP